MAQQRDDDDRRGNGVDDRVEGEKAGDGRLVVVYLLALACVWFSWSSAMHAGAPGDNIEQLNWAHGFEFGYYKHPPLPTWLLYPLQQLFGARVWLTRLLGEACIVVALWTMWIAMRDVASRESVFVALVAGSCITYFSSRGYVYNHNTAMLPPLALAFLASLRLLEATRPAGTRMRDWLLLGLATGLGMLVKYQMALFVGSFALTLIACGALANARARRDALLAGLVSMLIFTPHLVWLIANDFPPLRYAAGNLGAGLDGPQRLFDSVRFVAQQIGRASPVLIALGLAALFERRSRGREVESALAQAPETPVPETQAPKTTAPKTTAPESALRGREPAGAVAAKRSRELLLLCAGPAVLTIVFGLVSGARLQNHWGTGVLLLMLPLLATAARWRFGASRMLVAAVLVQSTLAGIQLLAPTGATIGVAHDYTAYPAATLAREALAVWREVEPSREPALIVGPGYEAGQVAAALANSPPVLIDGVRAHAPWVDRTLADACGGLLVRPIGLAVHRNDSLVPAQDPLAALPWDMETRIVLRREVSIAWRWREGRAPIVLEIGVIAPQPGADRNACRAGT